jgi:hypothetical protein
MTLYNTYSIVVNLYELTSIHNSLRGPTARKIKKEARDTLALLAKGFRPLHSQV